MVSHEGGAALAAGSPTPVQSVDFERVGTHWARLIVLATPALVLGLVSSLLLERRAVWADEAYTALAASKTWSQLFALLTQQQDSVHGAYYALMKLVVGTFGASEVSLRAPSVMMMALACLGVTKIANDLLGLRAGLIAGFIFAGLPIVLDYATEARSYALSVALATWATWVLVWQLRRDRPSGWGWMAYALLLTLNGLAFLYGWLVVFAHLTTLLLSRSIASRTRIAAVVAMAFSGLLLVPLVLLARSQSGQVGWITRDTVRELQLTFGLAFERAPEAVSLWWGIFWLIIGWGTLHAIRRTSRGSSARFLASVSWPWALLPGFSLVALSFVRPTFTDRYLTFTAPAVALLLALAVTQMSRLWSVVAIALLLLAFVLSLPVITDPGGRDGWGAKSTTLELRGEAGDAVVFSPGPYAIVAEFSGLPSGLKIQTVAGLQAAGGAAPSQVADLPERVWLVPFLCVQSEDRVALETLGYRLSHQDEGLPCSVQEYVLRPGLR